MGADHTLLADTQDAREMCEGVKAALREEPDISIECSGAESAVRKAIYVSNIE